MSEDTQSVTAEVERIIQEAIRKVNAARASRPNPFKQRPLGTNPNRKED
jgi:hypothetical protein